MIDIVYTQIKCATLSIWYDIVVVWYDTVIAWYNVKIWWANRVYEDQDGFWAFGYCVKRKTDQEPAS